MFLELLGLADHFDWVCDGSDSLYWHFGGFVNKLYEHAEVHVFVLARKYFDPHFELDLLPSVEGGGLELHRLALHVVDGFVRPVFGVVQQDAVDVVFAEVDGDGSRAPYDHDEGAVLDDNVDYLGDLAVGDDLLDGAVLSEHGYLREWLLMFHGLSAFQKSRSVRLSFFFFLLLYS